MEQDLQDLVNPENPVKSFRHRMSSKRLFAS